MATAVFFHAHPDDECTSTGGTIAKAVAAGHRVVLVTATRGELGECPEGLLADGEELWERRVRELEAASRVLGVARGEFLGYRDSGMIGTPGNDDPACFWRADVEEAAQRLAAICAEEQADLLTVYDDNGAYGHPDHIQVHRVGVRAAEIAGIERVYEATMNRDHIQRLMREMPMPEGVQAPDPEEMQGLGVAEDLITTCVDVRGFLDVKRQAMACHETQVGDIGFFLAMPPEAFEMGFGSEWYVRRGAVPSRPWGDDLFADL
ncbi:MAG: PIG-L family deacetylase [Acidimicrobiia bacterium]